ncbi:hypothetical protein EW146_g2016 [Bondarzewia mesenterica]|uniref:Uncharacterized protein n=1 Tax=Bondarzewia mesenterica TaxID=1095465 RepID=A0A4S4M243_9AGAM|nr:hypothetical protein EW146_g2016 [Bondarzewia mesenterica]
MAQPTVYNNPPLAGRPPFATDEPDSIYAQTNQPQRRVREPPVNPNARTSAYNHYDRYLDDNRQSGIGAVGMGLMTGDVDDDDEDEQQHDKHAALAAATQPQLVPLAAPRPGYPAPIAALNLSRPAPVATPEGRQLASPQMSQLPPSLRPSAGMSATPRAPPPALLTMIPPPAPISVPSTPHPLPPTMTPIQPVFARPAKNSPSRDVKWGPEPIMRGNSEETLIPKRGEKGDDFWRRFSMIAKEENKKPYAQKKSAWLRKTENGTNRLSRWVWIIGFFLLVCIGLASGLGWYATHNKPAHQQPKVFGGSENETLTSAGTATGAVKGSVVTASSSSSPHVSPTNTVARREASPDPIPTGSHMQLIHIPHDLSSHHTVARHRRRHLNRTNSQ